MKSEKLPLFEKVNVSKKEQKFAVHIPSTEVLVN